MTFYTFQIEPGHRIEKVGISHETALKPPILSSKLDFIEQFIFYNNI